MASDEFQNDPTGEAGRTNFWVNTVAQLPNFTKVIGHGFKNQFWLVIVVGVVEVGVLILWGIMRKLERELWTK